MCISLPLFIETGGVLHMHAAISSSGKRMLARWKATHGWKGGCKAIVPSR